MGKLQTRNRQKMTPEWLRKERKMDGDRGMGLDGTKAIPGREKRGRRAMRMEEVRGAKPIRRFFHGREMGVRLGLAER